MHCPICGTTEVTEALTGNEGEMYVAEESSGGTECYDPDIQMYQCAKGHTFYVNKDQ